MSLDDTTIFDTSTPCILKTKHCRAHVYKKNFSYKISQRITPLSLVHINEHPVYYFFYIFIRTYGYKKFCSKKQFVLSDSRYYCKEILQILKSFLDINLDDESVLWLKLNSEPWSTVLEKWNQTFQLRKKTKLSSVQQFLEYWPTLYDLRAESLVNKNQKYYHVLYIMCIIYVLNE